MNSIYKYELEMEDVQILALPPNSSILNVKGIGDKPYLYAVIDLDTEETVDRTILMFGTGHEIEDNLKAHYIGTFLLYAGAQVYHVFEKVR